MKEEIFQQLRQMHDERAALIAAMKHAGSDTGNPYSHKAMQQLSHFLAHGVSIGADLYSYHSDSKFHDPISYVLAKGEKYYGSPLPDTYLRGSPRECFLNASTLVFVHRELRYCEGYAMRDGHMPVLHGWAVDGKGLVIDNTFEEPNRCAYIGVTYDRKKYIRYVDRKGFHGILGGLETNAERVLRVGGL